MSRARRPWWLVYGLCSALALAALSWVSFVVLRFERESLASRAEADHQQALRLAMWRMDAWFAPTLAREASRPYFEYESYYSQDQAYTRVLGKIAPGEVLSPSPLIGFRSDQIKLHFQLDQAGAWSSPQVPTGNWLDLAQHTGLDAQEVARREALLADLRGRLDFPFLTQVVGCNVENFSGLQDANRGVQQEAREQEQQVADEGPAEAEWAKTRQEFNKRAQSAYQAPAQNVAPGVIDTLSVQTASAPIATESFVPVWLDPRVPLEQPDLCFVRRVDLGGRQLLQGFLCDWPALRGALLHEIADLFPDAGLVPEPVDATQAERSGRLLAAVPASLDVTCAPPATPALASPARTTLAVMWGAAVLALLAVGMTLRASVLYAEKRSRFASAVTHELRTPLTTFRMYSEMLAKDMVPPAERPAYLETLRSESDRLATLVENVLSYAKLEDGRSRPVRSGMSARELLDRVLPALRRRAGEAGARFHEVVGDAGAARVETDPEVVGQILFNLVENACKYGRNGGPAEIALEAARDDGRLVLRVRDRGPGVPPRVRRSIFDAFERGERDPADPNPGIGLGLALARGLARDLGGDLSLEEGDGGGACFRLELPAGG